MATAMVMRTATVTATEKVPASALALELAYHHRDLELAILPGRRPPVTAMDPELCRR
jgi:hypothetical protein